MKLSLQDRVALIYTSAGSQREVARQLGISHQKVGRILHHWTEGGYRDDSRTLRDPALLASVDRAFAQHTRKVVEQAKRDRLPYSSALPVFQQRMPRTVKAWQEKVNKRTGEITRIYAPVKERGPDGKLRVKKEPGERTEAPNTHWLSDKLRNAWIMAMQRSGKYLNVSVGSVVNLASYNRNANALRAAEAGTAGATNTRSAIEGKRQLLGLRKKRPPVERHLVQTPYRTMDPRQYPEQLAAEVQDLLTRKHQPATGDPGTLYATRVLLQTLPDVSKLKQKRAGKNAKSSKQGKARKPTR